MKKILIFLGIMCIILSVGVVFANPNQYSTIIDTGDTTQMQKIGEVILGVIQTVSVIVAIMVIIYVGIRFMLAAPGEKANIKAALTPYVIGAVIIFAASSLANLIYNLSLNIK